MGCHLWGRTESDTTEVTWQQQQQYIHTMECYSAIKKNNFESVLVRWVNLEPVIQNEVSHKEKNKYSILTHIYGLVAQSEKNLPVAQETEFDPWVRKIFWRRK